MELTTFVLFPSVATKLLQRLSFSQSACWCKIQYKGIIGCPIAFGSITAKPAVYPTTLKVPSVVNDLGVNGKMILLWKWIFENRRMWIAFIRLKHWSLRTFVYTATKLRLEGEARCFLTRRAPCKFEEYYRRTTKVAIRSSALYWRLYIERSVLYV